MFSFIHAFAILCTGWKANRHHHGSGRFQRWTFIPTIYCCVVHLSFGYTWILGSCLKIIRKKWMDGVDIPGPDLCRRGNTLKNEIPHCGLAWWEAPNSHTRASFSHAKRSSFAYSNNPHITPLHHRQSHEQRTNWNMSRLISFTNAVSSSFPLFQNRV